MWAISSLLGSVEVAHILHYKTGLSCIGEISEARITLRTITIQAVFDNDTLNIQSTAETIQDLVVTIFRMDFATDNKNGNPLHIQRAISIFGELF
jgi:hypothetical protein